jgi:hypothetical protein
MVQQQGLERPGVEERLVVARAGHDQDVAVAQQGGVDAVHPELSRDVQLGPQPVLRLVRPPGDLIMVVPASYRRADRRDVDGQHRARQDHGEQDGQDASRW